METRSFTPAVCIDSLSNACVPAGKSLLDHYCAQMIADQIPWRKRTLMLSSATQFLLWWRKFHIGDEYQQRDSAGSKPNNESAWPDLREAYLRFACPERDLRQEERACLNHFLRFMQAA